jgi:hypothetical protein
LRKRNPAKGEIAPDALSVAVPFRANPPELTSSLSRPWHEVESAYLPHAAHPAMCCSLEPNLSKHFSLPGIRFTRDSQMELEQGLRPVFAKEPGRYLMSNNGWRFIGKTSLK